MPLLRGAEPGEATRPRRQRFGAPPPDGVTAQQTAPFGWAPLVILVAVGIVDAMESRIIGGALQVIIDEFGISDAAAGAIPTAVTVAGAVVTLPAGDLADRYNRTNLMALVVLSWAFLLVGTALATSFAVFFAMRVVLGAADSIDNPASGSLLGDYYPPLTRAKVFGWARLTTYAGGAIGTVFGAVVADTLGWRWAYALMVIPGLICAWLCWRLREPIRGFIDQITATNPADPVPAPASPDDEHVPAGEKLREVATAASRSASGRSGAATILAAAVVVLAFAAGLLVGRLLGAGGGLLGLVSAAGAAGWCWRRRERLRDAVAPLARASGPMTDEATDEAAARAQLNAQLDFRQQVTGVFKVPTLRLVTLGLMAMVFGLGGIVYWVPTLMHRNFDIAVGTAGTISGLVSVVGLIGGTMYGGRLGRLWHGTRRGGRLLAERRRPADRIPAARRGARPGRPGRLRPRADGLDRVHGAGDPQPHGLGRRRPARHLTRPRLLDAAVPGGGRGRLEPADRGRALRRHGIAGHGHVRAGRAGCAERRAGPDGPPPLRRDAGRVLDAARGDAEQ